MIRNFTVAAQQSLSAFDKDVDKVADKIIDFIKPILRQFDRLTNNHFSLARKFYHANKHHKKTFIKGGFYLGATIFAPLIFMLTAPSMAGRTLYNTTYNALGALGGAMMIYSSSVSNTTLKRPALVTGLFIMGLHHSMSGAEGNEASKNLAISCYTKALSYIGMEALPDSMKLGPAGRTTLSLAFNGAAFATAWGAGWISAPTVWQTLLNAWPHINSLANNLATALPAHLSHMMRPISFVTTLTLIPYNLFESGSTPAAIAGTLLAGRIQPQAFDRFDLPLFDKNGNRINDKKSQIRLMVKNIFKRHPEGLTRYDFEKMGLTEQQINKICTWEHISGPDHMSVFSGWNPQDLKILCDLFPIEEQHQAQMLNSSPQKIWRTELNDFYQFLERDLLCREISDFHAFVKDQTLIRQNAHPVLSKEHIALLYSMTPFHALQLLQSTASGIISDLSPLSEYPENREYFSQTQATFDNVEDDYLFYPSTRTFTTSALHILGEDIYEDTREAFRIQFDDGTPEYKRCPKGALQEASEGCFYGAPVPTLSRKAGIATRSLYAPQL